ncbi:phosphate regulon transcriptional regulator PhoB [Polynucleobacter sp.]|uniref:phosphate regulon transcriptional regulator PhoB n=1 Tax=Polynucleobacter sp. TaxID=2029855 RepID=UPI002735552D|nr:phosphate regulon transcriptional regulator PhoB [Polynucleobacter sp.]MDP3121497.1 phosphate regulon transcriptional regulator PhoB [Polynucleobacter sp.]
MPQHILVVEDEPSIAELISINLTYAGYAVSRALQADEALLLLRNAKPDLVILDWMMPGKSGVQFARELKSNPATQSIPILMLTAKGEEADKVLGLDAGADDYVTKPFSPKELVARVKALLRRHVLEVVEEKLLILGPMQLDPVAHRLTIRISDNNSKALALGPTEFRLMQFLMANPERVHSRTHLLDNVWGNEVYIEERTVDVHIKRLRAALAPFACDHFVETVRGSGYRITKSPVNT